MNLIRSNFTVSWERMELNSKEISKLYSELFEGVFLCIFLWLVIVISNVKQ